MTTKKVSVYSQEGSRFDKLPEFLSWINGIVDQIPQEYRADTDVEITSSVFYDSSMVDIEISYYRPMTDEELRAAAQQQSAHEREVQAREISALCALQAKYPTVS